MLMSLNGLDHLSEFKHLLILHPTHLPIRRRDPNLSAIGSNSSFGMSDYAVPLKVLLHTNSLN